MAPAASAILEPGSPSSRRNKGKLEEAIQSLSKELNNGLETGLELPTDPDAQATVTDFLDFTEYLPADMHRSIILIGNQDRIYLENSIALDTALKSYSKFHEIPADKRPDSEAMRAKISDHVGQNIAARTHAHAEALRMDQNVGRHVVRAKNILAKLMKMAEDTPPSREASPTPELIRSIPKNPLRQDGARVDRKHRAPRITVPGEVLAPFDTGYNTWGSDSDSDDLEEVKPSSYKEIPDRSAISDNKKASNVVKKDKKDKATGVQKEKVPRGSRPPGVMGTNVHSAVAGISTSNALAMLAPIPASAVPGDKHLPWLELNEYELGTLRKTMKKNALWVPSDTMKARSLAESGRGYENYMKAVERAAAEGKTIEVPPQLRGVAVTSSGAISLEALRLQDNKTINRGMRLNEAKKAKRLKEKMEAAEVATQEAEAALHKMAFLQSNMANIFVEQTPKAKPVAPKAAPKSAPKKRKRESSVVEETVQVPAVPGMLLLAAKPVLKRAKTETPVPVPQTIFAKQVPLTSSGSAKSTASPAPTITPVTPVVENTPELLALPVVTTRQSSTPILPPKKELRKIVKKEIPAPEPTPNTRSRRSDEVVVPLTPDAVPEPLIAKRPSSSRDKKGSEEPAIPFVTTTSDRPRRTSTARNTPAPPEPHKMNRRAKRPPPGAVSAQSETSTIVSNRSKATSKKARVKKEKKDEPEDSINHEVYEEFDDEGKPIDPNEPRYCLCNRVSFGEMISCDNKDCPIEWFHLECVALVTAPRKSTKWYCPDCRVTLKKGGPTGQVTARGKFF